MQKKDILWKLRRIRRRSSILWLTAALFVAFGSHFYHMAAAILIMAINIIFELWCYRCPYCQEHLDMRLKLDEQTHCPRCGMHIADWKEEEQK